LTSSGSPESGIFRVVDSFFEVINSQIEKS